MDEVVPLDEEFLVVVVDVGEILDTKFLELALDLADVVFAVLVDGVGVDSLEDVGGVEVDLLLPHQ